MSVPLADKTYETCARRLDLAYSIIYGLLYDIDKARDAISDGNTQDARKRLTTAAEYTRINMKTWFGDDDG